METIVDDSSEQQKNPPQPTNSANQDTVPNFYGALGLPRNATEAQIQQAFDDISARCNPDVNPGVDAEAIATFTTAVEAYQLLTDPVNRKNYDQLLDGCATPLTNRGDTSARGRAARVFGSVMSGAQGAMGSAVSGVGAFLANTPNMIGPQAEDVTESALAICKDGGIIGGGAVADPRVVDLGWGWATDARVQHKTGSYFRLTVNSRQAENGFVLLCRSMHKDKFKLIMFNAEGAVLFQEDSIKSRTNKYTEAAFYFTTFSAYRLGEAGSSSQSSSKSGSTSTVQRPEVFSKLEEFDDCQRSIVPGQYLVCVYGDNFLGKSSFSLMAVLCKNESHEIPTMEEADDSLCESKVLLDGLAVEYAAAKAAYDDVYRRVKEEGARIDSLISTREKAYSAFLEESIATHSIPHAGADDMQAVATSSSSSNHTSDAEPTQQDGAAPAEQSSGSKFGLDVASITSAASIAASTATSVGTNAASKATAASGWLARRVSLGAEAVTSFVSRSRAASQVAQSTTDNENTIAAENTDEDSVGILKAPSPEEVARQLDAATDSSAADAPSYAAVAAAAENENAPVESSTSDAAPDAVAGGSASGIADDDADAAVGECVDADGVDHDNEAEDEEISDTPAGSTNTSGNKGKKGKKGKEKK